MVFRPWKAALSLFGFSHHAVAVGLKPGGVWLVGPRLKLGVMDFERKREKRIISMGDGDQGRWEILLFILSIVKVCS